MGSAVFGVSAESKFDNSSQTSGDSGRNIRGAGLNYAEQGAVAVGKGGNFNAGLQLNVKGGKGKNSGPSITINDSAPLADAIKQNSASLENILGQQTDLVKDALGKVADTTQSQQTGGVSLLNKTFLWLVLGFFGTVALVFYFRRS